MRAKQKAALEMVNLSQAQCRALLARHHVGRIAFTFHDAVDIEPIHYVYAGRQIVFRTAVGAKFDVLRHHPWVAFEVDEADGMFDWRSVVVHGTVYRLEPDLSKAEGAGFERAIRQLRTLLPETLRETDPVAFRTIVMRLYIDRMTGRASRTAKNRRK